MRPFEWSLTRPNLLQLIHAYIRVSTNIAIPTRFWFKRGVHHSLANFVPQMVRCSVVGVGCWHTSMMIAEPPTWANTCLSHLTSPLSFESFLHPVATLPSSNSLNKEHSHHGCSYLIKKKQERGSTKKRKNEMEKKKEKKKKKKKKKKRKKMKNEKWKRKKKERKEKREREKKQRKRKEAKPWGLRADFKRWRGDFRWGRVTALANGRSGPLPGPCCNIGQQEELVLQISFHKESKILNFDQTSFGNWNGS